MMWVAVIYAVIGSWLTYTIGRPLCGSISISSATTRISATA